MNSRMSQTNPFALPRSVEKPPRRNRFPRAVAPLNWREALLERVPETPGRFQLRGVTGVMFILFGLMKMFDTTLPILVGAPGLQVATGPEGFGALLSGLGVPFPMLNAYLVIAMETGIGLALILGPWLPGTKLITRLGALALAGDMTVALLVGLRQVQGEPVVLQGVAVMNQFWRLPLEIGLLLGMAYLVWKPVARSAPVMPHIVPVPVPVPESE
ncbi:MAG TPA: DoxX family protein [Archangium sp.]|jgi:uncharacterized membrane protein YphA (DoxX/SURF4 family)|uniref:DoxX family protein n=1 Tax=Archangium sp. TaxID=1872627 RepID=UPI002EDA246A